MNPLVTFNSSENRTEHRCSWVRKAHVEVQGLGTLNVRTHDISEHGLCFFAEEPLKEGSLCNISTRLYLSDSIQVLKVSGKVVYCWLSGMQGYRIGIEFRKLDEHAKKLLREIVNR